MRSLAFLGASALLVEGARVRNKRRDAGETENVDCYSAYDGKPAVGVKICSQEELQEVLPKLVTCTFLTEFFDGMPADGSCLEDTMVCDEDVSSMLEREYPTKVNVLHHDAGAYFRGTGGTAQAYVAAEGMELSEDFFSEWRTHDAMGARVEAAVAASGGIAKIEVAGKSLEGRDMKIVRFTGAGYRAGAPKVVLTFNLHAREWITGMAGVYAVEKLIEKVKGNPGYLNGIEVVMMPMANPDGFIHSEGLARFHRKNMNRNSSLCLGTDLNRNFPTGWGECGIINDLQCGSVVPCLDTFRGREAGGEPETQVVMKVFEESKMTVAIDVHSFTQLILSSWAYTKDAHPREAEFTALGTKMQDAVQARHGAKYTYGPTAQTLYAAAGAVPDYATSLGALGYCYELRPESKAWSLLGFAPPASYILPSAEEAFDGFLVAIEHAKAERASTSTLEIPDVQNTCSAEPGHCGRAYQGCCIGFGGSGHPCGCKLQDGSGKSGSECGTCGTAYAACCIGYELSGHPCQCDVM